MEEIKRRLENIELALFGKSDDHWHETGELSDGTMVGRIGAMTHIIDPQTKTPLSAGFHEIKVDIPNYRYLGQVGATKVYFDLETYHRKIRS